MRGHHLSERAADIPWVCAVCDEAHAADLARAAGIPPVIAQLLINRGVCTTEDAQQFLNPSLDHLHSPFLLPDMEQSPLIDRLDLVDVRVG